jgi:enediyne biosynthesis protein E4
MQRALPILAVAILLGVGGYFAYEYFGKAPPPAKPPELNEAKARAKIEVPELRFTDVTKAAGIAFTHENGMAGKKLIPETMGGGVAVLDFDRDDKPDLFFVNSCPWPGREADNPNALPKLYRNKGDGTFEDVSAKNGFTKPMYGMGAAVGDIDNDGYPDLFVSCVGKHHLFHNEAGKTFKDTTESAGVGGNGDWPKATWDEFLKLDKPIPVGASATFLDYDGDGKLDLFVTSYVAWSPAVDLAISSTATGVGRSFAQPKEYNGSQCWIFRNVDGAKFEDVSSKAGIEVREAEGIGRGDRLRNVGKSLGVCACDADGDGWPDIVVANDTVRNFFFHNVPGPNGTRVFQEIGVDSGAAYPDEGKARGGMGIDWFEYRPGKSAILVANFADEPATFLNRTTRDGKVRFTDTTLAVGLVAPSRKPLKFGAFAFDADLDGRLDLFVANGHIEPEIAKIQGGQAYEQAAQLYWNTADEKTVYELVPPEKCGPDLVKPLVGRGCAYLDYDGDGDLDIVLVGNGGEARLLRNDQKLGQKFVRLQLEGVKANRSAIGAELTIVVDGRTLKREVAGARGYLSQSESTVTVGLGTASKIDKLTVRWPGRDGGTQDWTDLAAGKTYLLKQGEPAATPASK